MPAPRIQTIMHTLPLADMDERGQMILPVTSHTLFHAAESIVHVEASSSIQAHNRDWPQRCLPTREGEEQDDR
ncbi:unnamed protein product [Protopolystoma xenopodis]|uniref:Uncharacterized protein n=1 Tax=Protopolystoma xenopodis TaxID=117903 RepID=A0A3S5BAP6_9PLAT|nr:unnamed protein product [Protopolystoma xenopodis]